MKSFKVLYLSPMIPSFNIPETLSFFQNILGFSIVMNLETYAICQRDNLTIHILPAGENIGQMEFYMEIDDLETLWENIKNKIQDLKAKGPFDQDYGMREIHIGVPQTNALLFIGQEIKR